MRKISPGVNDVEMSELIRYDTSLRNVLKSGDYVVYPDNSAEVRESVKKEISSLISRKTLLVSQGNKRKTRI